MYSILNEELSHSPALLISRDTYNAIEKSKKSHFVIRETGVLEIRAYRNLTGNKSWKYTIEDQYFYPDSMDEVVSEAVSLKTNDKETKGSNNTESASVEKNTAKKLPQVGSGEGNDKSETLNSDSNVPRILIGDTNLYVSSTLEISESLEYADWHYKDGTLRAKTFIEVLVLKLNKSASAKEITSSKTPISPIKEKIPPRNVSDVSQVPPQIPSQGLTSFQGPQEIPPEAISSLAFHDSDYSDESD